MLRTSTGGGKTVVEVNGCCVPIVSTVVTVGTATPFWPSALLAVVVKFIAGVESTVRVGVAVALWRVVVTMTSARTSAAGKMVALATPAKRGAPVSLLVTATENALPCSPDKKPGNGASQSRIAPSKRIRPTIAKISATRGVTKARER